MIRLNIKPLSVNACWQGRRFKTKEYKQYEEILSYIMPQKKKYKGFINIHYKFYLITWGRRDVDNMIKPLQDILVKNGIIEDDRKIISFTAEKIKSKQDFIEIKIKNAWAERGR
ncbi:RusA family crossover junction endodeoxyribonuclease [Patescibacteria group bacterium]|nr:RusA family crossover junction endodeoxyribonuclease [Patescibacteria group bacterium]